jgi:starch synthase
MSGSFTPAIRFHPESHVIARQDLAGRHMANHEFLRALIRHGRLEELHGYMLTADLPKSALENFTRGLGATIAVHSIQPGRLDLLAERGGLSLDDPMIATAARLRSFVGHRAYALTGITHTTADHPTKAELADILTADVQPWDALICTSRAVAAMVNQILAAERARLSERMGANRFSQPLLPVIPLGVDTDRFQPSESWRSEWRKRLRIEADEAALLYVGRLHRVSKAHPLPMLSALGRVALRHKQKIHLILAGWWQYPPEEAVWREQAALLCPEIQLHMLDGRGEAVRRQIWSAADIFVSLVDNIQETFGLAPVEAMAARLPVVATDWDGFRDTVRPGLDGMLVPTLMAPPGYATDAARDYAAGQLNYGGMLSEVARMTVVDIRAAAEAIEALVSDRALRRRMGAAGQIRARQSFDWTVVIPQHQALWREQQAIRSKACEPDQIGIARPDPRHMDPTQAFEAWPSTTFSLSQRLGPEAEPPASDVISLLNFTASALPSALHEDDIMRLLSELRQRGEASAEELLNVLDPPVRAAGARAILWLMRTGLIVRP